MSKSQRLTLKQIRQVHELIDRIRDFGDRPEIWQRIALEGLLRLLGGNIGFSVDIRLSPQGIPQLIDPIDTGWQTESARRRFEEYAVSGEMTADPGTIKLLEAQKKSRFLTVTRRQLVDDQIWYRSPSVSEARRSGDVDDFVIYSAALMPKGSQGLIIYRAWDDKPFEPRHRRIMQFFGLELLRAIKSSHTTPPVHTYLPQLPPRLRGTFELMLSPISHKQIAEKLHLSHHTINDYQKQIYKMFSVNSRPELMCLFRPSKLPIRLPPGLWEDAPGGA
jgi:hypothetical protein